MTKATTATPESILEATRREKGVTKAHLARLVRMDEANLVKYLKNWRGYRLSDERRALIAKELGIPEFIVQSWSERTAA